MGVFRIVSKAELRIRRRLNPDEIGLFDEFKAHLVKMDAKEAGVYEFSSEEDPDRCAQLLRKAAKSIDMPIRIRREEGSLVFYRRAVKGRKKVA